LTTSASEASPFWLSSLVRLSKSRASASEMTSEQQLIVSGRHGPLQIACGGSQIGRRRVLIGARPCQCRPQPSRGVEFLRGCELRDIFPDGIERDEAELIGNNPRRTVVDEAVGDRGLRQKSRPRRSHSVARDLGFLPRQGHGGRGGQGQADAILEGQELRRLGGGRNDRQHQQKPAKRHSPKIAAF